MRLLSTAGLAAAVLVIAAPGSGLATRSSDSAGEGALRCAKGSVDAVVAGKGVCLRRGARCTKRFDRQYHAYWFHCHSGRLAGAPSAGRVIASIPAPAVGGLTIGAGSVWVANMNPRTVTRIDPETNAIVATISLGEPDFLWGPTRLAFGHGSVWALDAMSSSVVRIDPRSNRITTTIPLGSPTQVSTGPLGLVVTSDAVWVANTWGTTEAPDGSVVRIDPQTNRIVARVALGSSPTNSGPMAVAASDDAVWVSVPSTRSVVRIQPTTGSVAAEVPGLACAHGQLAADESSLWVADCTSIRRIDLRTNAVTLTVPMPRATGVGVLGVAVGLGSVWVQAGPLVRIDPASGTVTSVLLLEPVVNHCAYSIAFGFDSIWVRQHDRVVRIRPA